jgi:hypothetical protein
MNDNKSASMDAVGELPDFGNLLLREGGYPHLSNTPKSDAWNDAGTKPDHPCLCVTTLLGDEKCQYWGGDFFGMPSSNKAAAYWGRDIKCKTQHLQWREVQP